MHKEGFKIKKPCFTILRSRLCISVRIRILITDLISMIDIPCFSCKYLNSNQRQILRFNLNFTCLVSNYLIFSTISCPNFALPVGLFCLLVLTKYRKRSDEICHWYRHHQPLDHVSQLRGGIGLTDVQPNNCRQYRKHQIYHDMITSWSPQTSSPRTELRSYLILFSFICGAKHKWFNITDTDRLLCQAGTATVNIPSSLSLSLLFIFCKIFKHAHVTARGK